MARRPTVIVGSYGPAEHPTIASFALSDDGVLRAQRTWAGVANASFVLAHPDAHRLYVVSETGLGSDGTPGAVHAFRLDRRPGGIDLVPFGHRSTGGDHPCHLSIDPHGRWLAASNYGTGDVAVFPILEDGDLGEMSGFVRHSGRGPNPDRQQGPHAHSTVFTPDSQFLIAADLGIDRLIVYRFEATTGSLGVDHTHASRPSAGPRTLAFHPDGVHLFVVNELDSTLSLLEYRAPGSDLRPLQTVSTLPDRFDEATTAADLRISPSGRHVYVSNRGHDSLAVFAFEPATGLQRRAVRPCGGTWPRSFELAPDGRSILVANRRSNEITSLSLLDGGSDIGPPVAAIPVAQPSCIAFV